MVTIGNPNASISDPWQATLLIFAFCLVTVGFNIFFARHLPLAEGIVLFLHLFAFFAFILTMWIIPGQHAPADQVFTAF
jgi:choline transport protein